MIKFGKLFWASKYPFLRLGTNDFADTLNYLLKKNEQIHDRIFTMCCSDNTSFHKKRIKW